MRTVLLALFSFFIFQTIGSLCAAQPTDAAAKPNIVILFADDLGYGDLSCYGNARTTTPHLNKLAKEGVRFTDFYVAQAVCGASRSALLTGCYPNRIGILGAPGPNSKIGIHENEKLLSELFREQGYAAAIFGKWHLGDAQKFLPLQHGFDEYFGLPYSNDMWPDHPGKAQYPPLPLIENNAVKLSPVTIAEQERLTTWYTERAVSFIERNRTRPFLLYVPYSMPHVPLHVSDKFRGKSTQGLYGDVLLEIDWSVGQITAALDKQGLREKTLVIFSSDNGPWLSYGNHAGSAGKLREGKGTTWEGGVRVPCIARWPGKIPAGTVCRELAATIDWFPTVAKLCGGKLPEHPIDGLDLGPLLLQPETAKSPREAYWYYWNRELQAIRGGEWKLHFPHDYRSLAGPAGKDGQPNGYKQLKTPLALYNLRDDPGETRDLAAERPEVVTRLEILAAAACDELGDSLQQRTGRGVREPGMRE